MPDTYSKMTTTTVLRAMSMRAVAAMALLLCLATAAKAADADKEYGRMLRTASGWSMARVVDEADRKQKEGSDGDALVLYMVACNRLSGRLADNDRPLCAIAHLRAGNIYYAKGSYANALEYYVKGLKAYEACRKQVEIGRFYNNIGNIYCVFQDFEKGMDYYKKSYAYNKKYGDRKNMQKVLTNMAGVYTILGNIKEARKAYAGSERLRDKGDKVGEFMSRYNESMLLVAENHYAEAIASLRGQIAFARRNKLDAHYLCSAYWRLCRAYGDIGRRDSALVYLDLCRDEARAHGLMHRFVDILKTYADLYAGRGDEAASRKYLAEYVAMKDSIYDLREFDVVKNSQFLYEMQKTSREIEDLQEQRDHHKETIGRQRVAITLTVLVILAVAGFSTVIMVQKRRLAASYKDLFLKNRQSIQAGDDMRRSLQALRDELRRRDEEAAMAPSGQGSTPQEGGTGGMAEAQKYQSSNLNDAQKQVIVEKVVGVMEDAVEFCSPDFSLERLAALVGSNRKYVSQAINDTFGKNFSNYVNEYRIRLACVRLADTEHYGNLTIKAIAEGVGFRSHQTFITVFRKQTGLTPSKYQSIAKAEAAEAAKAL